MSVRSRWVSAWISSTSRLYFARLAIRLRAWVMRSEIMVSGPCSAPCPPARLQVVLPDRTTEDGAYLCALQYRLLQHSIAPVAYLERELCTIVRRLPCKRANSGCLIGLRACCARFR